MKKNENWKYDHLEHWSFAELFAMKREMEERLQSLSRREPAANKRSRGAYAMWVGRNVECIDKLDKIRAEITRRKERAFCRGITGNWYDGNLLML